MVFTTIQKFMTAPELSERRNIIVIADEAHRSQYDLIDGLARHLRDSLRLRRLSVFDYWFFGGARLRCANGVFSFFSWVPGFLIYLALQNESRVAKSGFEPK